MSETASIEPVADTQNDAGKSTEDVKRKKKKPKNLDALLRDLPTDASEEEKIQLLCQKCHALIQEQRESAAKIKQFEHAIQSVRSERDQLQGDRNRLILQKDKLETLCRELQKQNKVVQEESLARCRAEDEKRRTISDHFQSSITSIQAQLNEYQTRNLDLRKENQELADKLEQFIKHHKQREEHVEKIIHTRELEVKLAEAKLQKSQCLLDQERIKSQQLTAQMKEETKLMQDRMDAHMTVENKLREQIEFYKTKYQTFNKTIAQSNKLFDNAKVEMEKLVKRIKQSEHDVVEWRGKWELSQRSLIELVMEHNKQTDELAAANKKIERLSNLCRALRAQIAESGQTTTTTTNADVDDGTPDERGDHHQNEPNSVNQEETQRITDGLATLRTEDVSSQDQQQTEQQKEERAPDDAQSPEVVNPQD